MTMILQDSCRGVLLTTVLNGPGERPFRFVIASAGVAVVQLARD